MRTLIVIVFSLLLSGCSGLSALNGLVGSEPEVTAQAGKENVKQTVGLTAKSDTSSSTKTTVKDSNVKRLDTSTKKQVSTTSITADNITAEKIEIQSKKDDYLGLIFVFVGGCLIGYGFGLANKKEA
ncbi:u-spanin [Hafnia phage Pocis76]|uniref:U-spanin n=1 Tax=Hafnia phage Pocis76 TaxID=2831174 RepID=A0A8E7KY39_9CAUD|nr:u-spanin [Hafnia phage Pocis76]